MEAIDFLKINKKSDLLKLLAQFRKENDVYDEVLNDFQYEEELQALQAELVNLQNWVLKKQKKIAIIFEGRDASGKGGTIRRFAEHLNPRAMRIVALNKPTEVERQQWYFNRYIKELPNGGEIVFFDRSWYNRAIVEPVNGFCTELEYRLFMQQVNEFEKMIINSGTYLIKLYFSITKEEQEKRFHEIKGHPLKKWKYSDVDKKAIDLWDVYTKYKEEMFKQTSTGTAPWKVFKANRKTKARIEALEYILEKIPYYVKDPIVLQHEEIE